MNQISASGSQRARILVIDDEAALANALKRGLSNEHEVEATTSGHEALQMLTQSPTQFDVIFCDLMMPEISGMDLYSQVKRARPGMEKRFVFMTGGAFTSASRDFLSSVSNHQIDKPFELKKIRSLVQAVLSEVAQ